MQKLLNYVEWLYGQYQALNGCEQVMFAIAVGGFVVGCVATLWKCRQYARMLKMQRFLELAMKMNFLKDDKLGMDDGKLHRTKPRIRTLIGVDKGKEGGDHTAITFIQKTQNDISNAMSVNLDKMIYTESYAPQLWAKKLEAEFCKPGSIFDAGAVHDKMYVQSYDPLVSKVTGKNCEDIDKKLDKLHVFNFDQLEDRVWSVWLDTQVQYVNKKECPHCHAPINNAHALRCEEQKNSIKFGKDAIFSCARCGTRLASKYI